VIVFLGEELMRKDLHSDPFGVAEAELEAIKKKERKLKNVTMMV
jgi:hypothetical protein